MEEQGNPGNSECSKCASHQLGAKVRLHKNLWQQLIRTSILTRGTGRTRKDLKGNERKKRKGHERKMKGHEWTWKETHGHERK